MELLTQFSPPGMWLQFWAVSPSVLHLFIFIRNVKYFLLQLTTRYSLACWLPAVCLSEVCRTCNNETEGLYADFRWEYHQLVWPTRQQRHRGRVLHYLETGLVSKEWYNVCRVTILLMNFLNILARLAGRAKSGQGDRNIIWLHYNGKNSERSLSTSGHWTFNWPRRITSQFSIVFVLYKNGNWCSWR